MGDSVPLVPHILDVAGTARNNYRWKHLSGFQTYATGYLVLDLLESFLGSSGEFRSHASVSCAADKLEGGSSKDS